MNNKNKKLRLNYNLSSFQLTTNQNYHFFNDEEDYDAPDSGYEQQEENDGFDSYDSRSYNSSAYYGGDDPYFNQAPNSYNSKPKSASKKKRTTVFSIISTFFGIVLIGVAGFLVWNFAIKNLVTNQNNSTSTSVSNNPSNNTALKDYQGDFSQTSIDAMKYIANHSLSLQFFFEPNKNTGVSNSKIVAGTGWIFNKQQNSDTYYIATNMHVATSLSYSGHNTVENNTPEDYSNYTLKEMRVGYIDINNVDPTNAENRKLYYSSTSADLNMVSVPIPQLVYLADAANPQINNASKTLQAAGYKANNSSFSPIIDLAILKFDFSSVASNAGFKNWLQYYNASPTAFYDTPFNFSSESINQDFYSRKFYMGGFPGSGAQDTNNQNYAGAVWSAFSNFSTIVNSSDAVTQQNYTSVASGADKESDMEKNAIPYFKNNTQYNLVNIGLFGLFEADSASGASGSMIVINTGTDAAPVFKVAAIYWGASSFTFGNGYNDENITVGSSNLLNISNYSVSSGALGTTSKSYKGYDIFYDATQVILSDANGTSLFYPYTSYNSIATSNK